MAQTLKDEAKKFLSDVPEENVFCCCDGRIFRNMKELAEALASMTDETFACHCNKEKNDFRNWVRDVIKDERLAADLAIVQNRLQAAKQVATRVSILTKRLA